MYIILKKTTFQAFNYLSKIVVDVDRLQSMQEKKEILPLLLFSPLKHDMSLLSRFKSLNFTRQVTSAIKLVLIPRLNTIFS